MRGAAHAQYPPAARTWRPWATHGEGRRREGGGAATVASGTHAMVYFPPFSCSGQPDRGQQQWLGFGVNNSQCIRSSDVVTFPRLENDKDYYHFANEWNLQSTLGRVLVTRSARLRDELGDSSFDVFPASQCPLKDCPRGENGGNRIHLTELTYWMKGQVDHRDKRDSAYQVNRSCVCFCSFHFSILCHY